ncbi:DUF551 domain-containing protein [uncultured Muribaculum sp.]|uniref:DUF551 domain-containing protein n=1 Tax=uncultured Muribaculum sp. TaxID=1918613 RepID=UPI0026EBC533|nr:DUF551 domain-containing protein [uncultured Muribaculum sp.]
MGKLPEIRLSQPPPPPRKMATPSPWHKVGEAEPEDCTPVLIRVYYKSAKTGRFTAEFGVFYYMAEFGGFSFYEKIKRRLGLKVTHWMPIPPVPK